MILYISLLIVCIVFGWILNDVCALLKHKKLWKKIKATQHDPYHFGLEDCIKGICTKDELGMLVDSAELKKRCIEAEQRDPDRYRYGTFGSKYDNITGVSQ